MSKPTTTTSGDAIYELSLDERLLNADLLEEYVLRFHADADELTEFAIDLAVARIRQRCAAPAERDVTTPALTSAVSRAASRFQNRLHAYREGAAQTMKSTDGGVGYAANPFGALSPQEYRRLVAGLGLSAVFVNKFRDRQVEFDSIPSPFVKELSDAMNVPVEVMIGHLQARQAAPSGQFFKADRKPAAAKQQSFQDAVRSSNLSPEVQSRLLNL